MIGKKLAKVMDTKLPLCLGRWSEDKQTQLYNNLRESPEQWHRDVVSESEEAQLMCSRFISISMPARYSYIRDMLLSHLESIWI